MAHSLIDPVDEVVDMLVDRHDVTPRVAADVLRRAARRKGVTLDDLAARIVGGPALVIGG